MDGILRCTRYAFGPNRLHYCGPDANSEISAYIENEIADPGLTRLLQGFQTMYPYLRHIANANGIRDAFDDRVVEAYWIGNNLLETIEKKQFYHHLTDGLRLPKRMNAKAFDLITSKVRDGAVPHHSFHVFDVWKRTGYVEQDHTLESLDSCRISWGMVTAIDGPTITVKIEPLMYTGGKLILGDAIDKKITRSLEAEHDIENAKLGDILTIHWDVPCEVVTKEQAAVLKKYTLQHIRLANQTL